MDILEPQSEGEITITEEQKSSGLKYVKLSIVLLFLLLLIGTLGFSIFSKKMITTVHLYQKQINSLIDEVGEVKEKNRLLAEVTKALEKEMASKEEDKEDMKPAAEEITEVENVQIPKNVVIEDTNLLDFLIVGHNMGLTDSIIIASVNELQKTVSFISIPRDLYIDGRKINEFYEFYGIEKLSEKVAKVTGITTEKYVVTDMGTFKKTVDLFGGIDVTVERDIYDYSYPDDSGYYEPYSIKKGDYHMNGEEALKYARSRKSTSDFDRSKRQQKILEAIREQIKKADYLNKMKDLVNIYTILLKDIKTNVDILEIVTYLRKFQDYKFETGNTLSTDNFLYSMISENNAYILLPEGGDYANVRGYIKDLVEK